MKTVRDAGVIGLIAAMPDEIRPLLKRVGKYRKGKLGRCNRFDFQIGERAVTLVESGMGARRAREATQALIEAVSPRFIVNFGFAGGVRRDVATADLVLARRVLVLEGGGVRELPLKSAVLAARFAAACGAAPVQLKHGTFITSSVIAEKAAVAQLLEPDVEYPVLEMETAAVVEVAQAAGVALVALRGISDAAHEELGFSLEEFCDAELNLKISRVLATVARKPWIIPQLLRLAGNSKKAGERMALCLETALKAL